MLRLVSRARTTAVRAATATATAGRLASRRGVSSAAAASAAPQRPRVSPIPSGAESSQLYARLRQRLAGVRAATQNRPLTLSEKLLFGHLETPAEAGAVVRGSTYLRLRPDRVAMQDASGQMALLQFISSGLHTTAVPATMHCDHLIVAQHDARTDLRTAQRDNKDVFAFLQSASAKYGVGFWGPGSGIIHQIVLENYAQPGLLMLGTDSHSPNAGGLGAMAVGVGGADAVDVMAGMTWELKAPKVIGIRLSGRLSGWASPKDIILKVAGLLTVKGGTGAVLEYFGPGVGTLSATGLATVANMGAEVGATSSVFPYTPAMSRYLRATGRAHIADQVEARDAVTTTGASAGMSATPFGAELKADVGAQYDRVIDIDLSALEPHFNGPFTPDASHPLSAFGAAVTANQWPGDVSAVLIGSCTNSSYEDMERVASVVRQAAARGLKSRVPLLVTPGSEQIRATLARDGHIALFESVGATVLANACGPCIGQWTRTEVESASASAGAADADTPKSKPKPKANSILTSYNRNFPKRNDGNALTHNFVASPELVTAMAFSGSMHFNPQRDTLKDAKTGAPFRFEAPAGAELPAKAFDAGEDTYFAPLPPGSAAARAQPLLLGGPNNTGTDRLQLMQAFPAWDGRDIARVPVLIKVKGQCTTDHISAAGPWLRYRGHLDNLSDNTLIGAISADSGKPNAVRNQLTGAVDQPAPATARAYQKAGLGWVVVAEDNYGEGSARESAALQPRHLGGLAVVAHSFARIHETNLKKQGLLPLYFVHRTDYDKVNGASRVSVLGLTSFAPDVNLTLRVHADPAVPGSVDVDIPVRHTFNANQIKWFKAGSALNAIKQKTAAKAKADAAAGTGAAL